MKSRRKPLADFSWTVFKDGRVHIIDHNLGNMSVTNDAENVVAAIHEQLDLTGRVVTYLDSEGGVDRLLHRKGEFMGFAAFKED